MKKTMSIIAIFAVLLLTVSANTSHEYHAAEGDMAPKMQLEAADGTTVSPSDSQSQYVIVNFWASNDAESRIAANAYDSIVRGDKEGQINLVSVNMDRNERLFREIVRRDGLDAEKQFNVQSKEASELINKFDMREGLQSYLLDSSGKIIAVNPSTETIAYITGV